MRLSSIGRRSIWSPRGTPSGRPPSAAGSRPRARRHFISTTSDRREVGRGDVADDLVDRVDPVLSEPRRVLADDVLVRCLVDAERPYEPPVVDHHVTVLPDDLREVVLDDLTRPPSDSRHIALADVE